MKKTDTLNEKSMDNYFKKFKEELSVEEMEQFDKVVAKLKEVVNYHPRIGVFGKTGSGKSSLCNALFGQDICKISDIAACTRNTQEVLLQLDEGCNMTLVDVPGAGETIERDEEYAALYDKLLPELDVVIWLLKADDRAYSVDQEFYANVVKPHLGHGKPFFMVLNQVDKIEPSREWNDAKHCPGERQSANIKKKRDSVCDIFGLPKSKVLDISAMEKYNLTELVNEIVFALPDEKKIAFVKEVKPEYVSTEAKQETKSALVRVCIGIANGAALGAKIGKKFGQNGAVAGAIIGGVVGGLCAFFGW